jgi:hypothetical protein
MECFLLLTHNHSSTQLKDWQLKLAQLTKSGWGELAGQGKGLRKLKMQREPAALKLEGEGKGV